MINSVTKGIKNIKRSLPRKLRRQEMWNGRYNEPVWKTTIGKTEYLVVNKWQLPKNARKINDFVDETGATRTTFYLDKGWEMPIFYVV